MGGRPRLATRTCARSWPGSAWALKHRPAVGVTIARRQQGRPPQVAARAWAAQQCLCARFRVLAARKHVKRIVAAAIAREPAGFLWPR